MPDRNPARGSASVAHGEARDRALDTFLYLGERLSGAQERAEAASDETEAVSEEGVQALFRAIEGEVIPRLLLAHKARDEASAAPARGEPRVTDRDRSEFMGMLLGASAAATQQQIEALLRRGVTRERVFMDLLAFAARELGALWEEDRCSFTEVTIGLCRLHQVLHENSLIGDRVDPAAGGTGPRILLATACADQHVFGVVMVAEFFRRARWRVWSEPGASRSELAAMLGRESFDVLGLSAACSAIADEIGSEIETLRKASTNTELKVLVGGRLFAEDPELVVRVGADGAAFDARSAPAAGDALLAREFASC